MFSIEKITPYIIALAKKRDRKPVHLTGSPYIIKCSVIDKSLLFSNLHPLQLELQQCTLHSTPYLLQLVSLQYCP